MFVKLLKRSFIQNGQHEAGEVLQLPDTDPDGKPTVLSDHMVKVDAPKPEPTPSKLAAKSIGAANVVVASDKAAPPFKPLTAVPKTEA